MLNQVNTSIELLKYLCDSTVLPQMFKNKYAVCTFLQSSLKVFNKLLKVIFCKGSNSTCTTMESFINNCYIFAMVNCTSQTSRCHSLSLKILLSSS